MNTQSSYKILITCKPCLRTPGLWDTERNYLLTGILVFGPDLHFKRVFFSQNVTPNKTILYWLLQCFNGLLILTLGQNSKHLGMAIEDSRWSELYLLLKSQLLAISQFSSHREYLWIYKSVYFILSLLNCTVLYHCLCIEFSMLKPTWVPWVSAPPDLHPAFLLSTSANLWQ